MNSLMPVAGIQCFQQVNNWTVLGIIIIIIQSTMNRQTTMKVWYMQAYAYADLFAYLRVKLSSIKCV